MNRIHEWYASSYSDDVFVIKGVAEIGGRSERVRTDIISAALCDRASGLIILTDNGGKMYTIYIDDMYIGRRCYPPQDWVNEIHIGREADVRSFCTHFGFDDLAEEIIFKKNEKIKTLEDSYARIAKMLPENTLYLALRDSGYYFHYGIYNVNGVTGNCDMKRHDSMFEDSLLVYRDADDMRYPLVRFFTREDNRVEFYNSLGIMESHYRINDGELLGYLYNSGISVLNVTFSWGKKIQLRPSEEIEVRYGMGE